MMANKDDINSFNDAMDAPTPLEEARILTSMMKKS